MKDWYDDFIERADDMNFYITSDWHLNFENMETHLQRPGVSTRMILERHNRTVRPEDTYFMLGDVANDRKQDAEEIIQYMNGTGILVRGNHDRQWSCSRWMQAGFKFACDGFKFRQVWLTHEPAGSLPEGCHTNIHGHLHNIWHGFGSAKLGGTNAIVNVKTGQPFEPITKLYNDWQRLFALEYTDYFPVEFDKFLARPERYQAKGPRSENVD